MGSQKQNPWNNNVVGVESVKKIFSLGLCVLYFSGPVHIFANTYIELVTICKAIFKPGKIMKTRVNQEKIGARYFKSDA